jgi:hypothetical protein
MPPAARLKEVIPLSPDPAEVVVFSKPDGSPFIPLTIALSEKTSSGAPTLTNAHEISIGPQYCGARRISPTHLVVFTRERAASSDVSGIYVYRFDK